MVKIGIEDEEESSSTDEEDILTPNAQSKKQSELQSLQIKQLLENQGEHADNSENVSENDEKDQKDLDTVDTNEITVVVNNDKRPSIPLTKTLSVSLIQKASASRNNFDILPDELVLRIYNFVDFEMIGTLARVSKRFRDMSGDEKMLQQRTAQYGGSSPSGEMSRSYYIMKFRQYKERQKKQLEEEQRQHDLQLKHHREDMCANIMTCVAFNRVHEWAVTFGLIFVTIVSILKLDGIVDWDWALILIPFYFILFQMVYAPIMYDSASVYFDRDFEDSLSDSHKYCGPIFYLLLYIMPLGNMSDKKKRTVVYGTILCVALFLLLFCIKVSSDSSMKWWGVFTPLLIQCVLLIAVLVIGNFDRIWEDDQWVDRALTIAMIVVLMLSFIFIFLKLDGIITWSWYLALIPLFILKGMFVIIPIVLTIVSGCASYWIRSKTRWSDETSAFCTVAVVVAVLLLAPLLTLEILLAQNAEGENNLSYVLMFIPLFVLEGCGCIGCVILNVVASSE